MAPPRIGVAPLGRPWHAPSPRRPRCRRPDPQAARWPRPRGRAVPDPAVSPPSRPGQLGIDDLVHLGRARDVVQFGRGVRLHRGETLGRPAQGVGDHIAGRRRSTRRPACGPAPGRRAVRARERPATALDVPQHLLDRRGGGGRHRLAAEEGSRASGATAPRSVRPGPEEVVGQVGNAPRTARRRLVRSASPQPVTPVSVVTRTRTQRGGTLYAVISPMSKAVSLPSVPMGEYGVEGTGSGRPEGGLEHGTTECLTSRRRAGAG